MITKSFQHEINSVYNLYLEIAEDILSPILDSEISQTAKFELYRSKLVFLYHLYEKCFLSYNQKLGFFTENDLRFIRSAIDMTKDYIREALRNILLHAINHQPSKKTRSNL